MRNYCLWANGKVVHEGSLRLPVPSCDTFGTSLSVKWAGQEDEDGVTVLFKKRQCFGARIVEAICILFI